MDAKMEQSIRLALEQAKGNERIDGVTRVVGIDASTGLAILSELDRLRELPAVLQRLLTALDNMTDGHNADVPATYSISVNAARRNAREVLARATGG